MARQTLLYQPTGRFSISRFDRRRPRLSRLSGRRGVSDRVLGCGKVRLEPRDGALHGGRG